MSLKNFSKLQWAVIFVGVIITVLLLLAPQKGEKKKAEESAASNNASIDSYRDSVELALTKEQLLGLKKLQEANNVDSIVGLWKSYKQPAMAAYYLQKKAQQKMDARLWSATAGLYYSGAKFADDTYRMVFINEAIASYEQALVIDSSNVDAKVSLAACYVEATNEPMKGIMMLRDVLKSDSNNISAHMNLGIFAIQSAQFDKAIDRFNKVLKINPDFLEAYLYLGQAYASMGKKDKAIEVLEKYKKLNKDEIINEEINKYINGLKNNS